MAKVNKKTKGRDAPVTGKGGRPAYQPGEKDRKIVQAMVAAGCMQQPIADILNITTKTLQKHYRRELDLGSIEANVTVASRLFAMTVNNVRAAEFWLTNRDKKNWAHTQKVAVDQNVTNNLGDRLARAQKQLKGQKA